jgi:mono/diheme cytochrome c family protein
MVQRGTEAQMPPFASKQVDEEGVAIVARWIASL